MAVGPICAFSVVGGLVVQFWEGGLRWLVDLCCFGMRDWAVSYQILFVPFYLGSS